MANVTGSRNIAEAPLLRQAAFISIAVYADVFNVLSISSLGTDKYGKYCYFIWIAVSYTVIYLTSRSREPGITGQKIFFSLTFIAFVPFTIQLLSGAEVNSYASAFAATLIYSASGIFDVSKYDFDTDALLRRTLRLLLVLCVLYDGELAFRQFSGLAYFQLNINETNHIKSICFVAGLSLAILTGDRRYTLACAALLALSLLLRPSSSLVLATAACAPICYLIRWGRLRLAEAICYVMLFIAAALPPLLYADPHMRDWLDGIETWMKQDVLSGTSNTLVRLAIQDLAFDRMQQSSWLFGEFFSGATSVEIMDILPWWEDNSPVGLAAIHSDFVMVLMEGGVVGYALFNLGFLAIIRTGFRALRTSRAYAIDEPLQGLGVVMAAALILYASTNPFLQYFGVSHVAWFLIALGALSERMVMLWRRSVDTERAAAFPASANPIPL